MRLIAPLGSLVAATLLLWISAAAASTQAEVIDLLHGAALQPDGKIVLVGSTEGGDVGEPARILVVRYGQDGVLDPTFGSRGRVTTALGEYPSYGYAVAIQGDGRIVVAADNSLVRYLTNGSLDPSFGRGGIAPLDLHIYHLLLQGDGKIVGAGDANGIGPELARFDSDGTLDASFGVGGRAKSPWGFQAIAMAPDGGLVGGGSTIRKGQEVGVIVRFLPNGVLDTGFGKGGSAAFATAVAALAVQTDGKVVVAGAAQPGASALVVGRYQPDGSLDAGFGGGSLSARVPRETLNTVAGIVSRPDGRVVVGGGTLAGFRGDGSLDTSFSGGFVGRFLGHTAVALLLQDDGKIVVPISTVRWGPEGSVQSATFWLRRYLPDGTLEAGFPTPWGRQRPSDPDLYRFDLLDGRETNLSRNLAIDETPAVAPNGRRVAFLSWRDGEPGVYAMKPEGSGLRRLTPNLIAKDVHVADYDRGQTTIAWSPNSRRIAFDAQGRRPAGCLLCLPRWSLWVMNADGSGRRLLADDARAPSWSPDGKRIVFEGDVNGYGGHSVEVVRVDGSNRRQIARGSLPAWSPQGKSIAFVVSRKDWPLEVDVINADGSGRRRVGAKGWKPFWSPDGRRLAYYDSAHGGLNGAIQVVALSGGSATQLPGTGWAADARWSPDGKWIAISSGLAMELVTPSGKTRQLVASAEPPDGYLPGPIAWSPDSRRIYFTRLPPQFVR